MKKVSSPCQIRLRSFKLFLVKFPSQDSSLHCLWQIRFNMWKMVNKVGLLSVCHFIFLKTNLACIQEMVFCYQNCFYLLWEKIVLVMEKTFESRGWKPRILKNFEIPRTIYSNSGRSEQLLVTECFFNLFLEVAHI